MGNEHKSKKRHPSRAQRLRKKKKSKIGLSPGSLVYVGDVSEGPSTIHLTRYNEKESETFQVQSAEQINSLIQDEKVNWFNITGIHNTEIVEAVNKQFQIHPLITEDILNTDHRPKLEIYDEYLFVSMKAVYPEMEEPHMPHVEQISFILGTNFVLTFQEVDSDYFQTIRKRIDREGSRLRSMKADYLLIALMDLVVDHYLSVVENIGDEVQNLEDMIYDNPVKQHLYTVMSNKRTLLYLWRIIQPIQESLYTIKGIPTELINQSNKIYLEDVYDHLSTVRDSLDLYIELNNSMRESYSYSIGLKTNEVMKLLTIISTLFIPLTFLVGVYGMNFENIPELSWEYGYFYVWGLMILITVLLIFYFKKRKWL